MEIRSRSDSHLYAQTAAFANAQNLSASEALQRDLPSAARALLSGEKAVVSTTGASGDRTVEWRFAPDDYISFLRHADAETRADIEYLAGKIDAYPAFAESVENVTDDHLLGHGSKGIAWRIEQGGNSFAVKKGGVGYRDVRAFRRAESVPGSLSRLLAIDLEKGHSVMNVMPGVLVPQLTYEQRKQIPPRRISDVVDLVIRMCDAGLRIDSNPKNFLYSEDSGYGIIDYAAVGGVADMRLEKARQVLSLTKMMVPERARDEYSFRMEDATDREKMESVDLLNGFLDVLEADYPEILAAASEMQDKLNASPVFPHHSVIYEIGRLPYNEAANAFRARLQLLGLQAK